MYDSSEVFTFSAIVIGLFGFEGLINWMVKLDGSVLTLCQSDSAAGSRNTSMDGSKSITQPENRPHGQ